MSLPETAMTDRKTMIAGISHAVKYDSSRPARRRVPPIHAVIIFRRFHSGDFSSKKSVAQQEQLFSSSHESFNICNFMFCMFIP
jgi:hypothetical protein